MQAALQAFRTYLEVECAASPHTIRNYVSDLAQFTRFAASVRRSPAPVTPAQIDADLIRAFLSQAHHRGVSHRSLSRKLSSLRSFLDFLQRRGELKDNVGPSRHQPKDSTPSAPCVAD